MDAENLENLERSKCGRGHSWGSRFSWGLIYDSTILGTAWVSGWKQWMAGAALIWRHAIPTLCMTLLKHVASHCKFRLTRLCVCLQPGSGHWASVQTLKKRTPKCFQDTWCQRETISENKGAVWTYLSRKSLSTTAEMSSKGFPIPKRVFSLRRDKSILFHPHSYSPTPHYYFRLFLIWWIKSMTFLLCVAWCCSGSCRNRTWPQSDFQ